MEEGRNDDFCGSFSFVISRISEYKNGNSNEDFGQRHEAFKSLQEPTVF